MPIKKVPLIITCNLCNGTGWLVFLLRRRGSDRNWYRTGMSRTQPCDGCNGYGQWQAESDIKVIIKTPRKI